MRKSLYGGIRDLPHLEQHIYSCTNIDVYDKDIFNKYSKEEIDKANGFIEHSRDFLFTYAGLRQVVDKYLVQDRSGGGVYESPQFMYIMIALTIFAEYPKEVRMNYVKKYYDAVSKHKINIPTPIMGGVRTPIRQFASCVLVDIDDTLDSIFSSDMPSVAMSLKGLVSVSTQAASVGSTVKSGVEKFNTQVLYRSSKSLKQLSDVALKMALEVDQRLSTSQSGTKKSET